MKKLDIIKLTEENNLTSSETRELLEYQDEGLYYYNDNSESTYQENQNRLILRKKNHIFYRYEVINALGRGAFSNVYKCRDHKRDIDVAVKVIRNENRFHKQASKCEIPALIKTMEINHQNLLKTLKIFDFKQHICISFELFYKDLYSIIKENNFSPLPLDIVKDYSKQILLGLDALKKLNIIHCDLKPENIMVTKDNIIKIIDLGSCFIYKNKSLLNNYIQSRYYRSPEVILGCNYDFGIDIWSFGCIVFEMLTGRPLFEAKSQEKMIVNIVKLIGLPNRKIVLAGTHSNCFFNICDNGTKFKHESDYYNNIPSSLTFEKLYKTENTALYNFLKKIINWDYENRPSPSVLLQTDFF